MYLDTDKLKDVEDEGLSILLREVNRTCGGWYLQEIIERRWWRNKTFYQLIKYRGLWKNTDFTSYSTKEFTYIVGWIPKKEMMLFLEGLLHGIYSR